MFVDDTIHLFINGTQVLERFEIWTDTHSQEVELRPGDRIVAQLKNRGGARGFMLLFVSTDLQQMVQFKSGDFRILPAPDSKDFDPALLASYRASKKDSKNERKPLPFKNRSDWVWGEHDVCTLGCQLSAEMFDTGPRR